MKVLTILFLFFINQIFCSENVYFIDKDLFIGDDCKMHDGTIGTCLKIADCYGIQTNSDLKMCGYDRDTPIVCCSKESVIDERSQNEDFIVFDWRCRVPRSNKKGRIMKEEYCPNAEKLPRACPYEICKDLVCCPDIRRNRLAQGKKYI